MLGLDIVITLVALSVVALAAILALRGLRWRLLCSRLGSFPCILVDPTSPGDHDRWGVAVFDAEALRWFARGSLRRRPSHEWPRFGLEVASAGEPVLGQGGSVGLESPDGFRPQNRPAAEARTGLATPLPFGHWETVRVTAGEQSALLVLSPGAISGLVSWTEAGPSRTETFR